MLLIREALLKDAIELWGERSQTDMMIEEMSELTKAIIKMRRGNPAVDAMFPDAAKEALLEEVADVQIMLDQMRIMYGETRDIEAMKLHRLSSRIKYEQDLVARRALNGL